MKKSLLVLAALTFLMSYTLESQGLLNKVKKAVSKEISGVSGEDNGNNTSKPGPEPACACENAKLIMDLGGKYNLNYSEISISMLNDGSMLVWDKLGFKYYIVKDGISQGPFDENDSKVKKFNSSNDEETDNNSKKGLENMYPDYLVKSGDKYLIKFGGKSYGPFALLQDFAVSRSKDKFVAVVTEDVIMNEDQGKKMEQAMKNAKTDQERMDLAMKMQQQMQEKMMNGAGTGAFQPKVVTNIPGVAYDAMTWAQTRLDGKVKFDELVLIAPDKILDLKGKTLFNLNQNTYQIENLFVNSSNTRYATYNYGTLTFNDNTSLSELFNPYLIKTDGRVYLTYMYYSPGKDAIMQCAIPF
jgi:hypothetical protein